MGFAGGADFFAVGLREDLATGSVVRLSSSLDLDLSLLPGIGAGGGGAGGAGGTSTGGSSPWLSSLDRDLSRLPRSSDSV